MRRKGEGSCPRAVFVLRGGLVRKKVVPVELSEHELVLLANAINEAMEAVDEREFQTRLGARREEADELHRKLSSILASLDGPDNDGTSDQLANRRRL